MIAAHPNDIEPMRRAIQLAMLGRGTVEPNPMVGCVIVKNGAVIGEGYHQAFGGPHAEPNALQAAQNPAGATAYVTLEPCCHLEKKTPPCVPLLIAAGLKRVVVACIDPNPMVAGKGIGQLRSAGITVDEGVLEKEAKQLNAAFFKRMELSRPYVTLKWAQSADEKVAGPGGRRTRISNEASYRVIHGLRARCDAILVGIGTALTDDPLLMTRGVQSSRKLLRIVLDKDLRLPISSQLARTAAQDPVRVYCDQTINAKRTAAISSLNAAGIRIKPLPVDTTGRLSLAHLLDDLGRDGVTHLLVEPGPTLAASFIAQNLADRVWIFRSTRRIDDATAPSAPGVDYPPTEEIPLDGDTLTEYLNPHSAVYFAPAASADLARAKG